jgi:hypothetical protein
MNIRSQYIANLLSIIGMPYRWGAWGPYSFDCSGAVSWAIGLTEKKCAAELYQMFKDETVKPIQAAPGALYFYGEDINHIDHVMSVLTHWNNGCIILVGACHGDLTTINDDVAKSQNAFIQTQPQTYWHSHFQVSVDPFDGNA